jgi:hypothetical protein
LGRSSNYMGDFAARISAPCFITRGYSLENWARPSTETRTLSSDRMGHLRWNRGLTRWKGMQVDDVAHHVDVKFGWSRFSAFKSETSSPTVWRTGGIPS